MRDGEQLFARADSQVGAVRVSGRSVVVTGCGAVDLHADSFGGGYEWYGVMNVWWDGCSLPIFRDGAGNDVLLAGIVNLLVQHLEVPDGGRSWWSNLCLVRSAKTSCSRISSIAEAVLEGSLCVEIVVPVMMVLARMLQTLQDYFLVPI